MTDARYSIRETLDESQVETLHALYQREWWTKGRTLDDVRAMLRHTDFVFAAVEEPSGALVGFARVLSDHVYKALVLDVIVADAHRGSALGRRLMDAITRHPDLARVSHFELYCLPDLEPFYAKWGFTAELGELRFLRASR